MSIESDDPSLAERTVEAIEDIRDAIKERSGFLIGLWLFLIMLSQCSLSDDHKKIVQAIDRNTQAIQDAGQR